MKAAALALGLWPMAATAEGMENLVFIDCVTGRGEDVSINLFLESRFGMELHCVLFAATDPAPNCAPPGGWGIVDPAEPGVITGVLTDPAEAKAAGVPMLWTSIDGDVFTASASEGPEPPLRDRIGGSTFWHLSLSLPTGAGRIETRDGVDSLSCDRM